MIYIEREHYKKINVVVVGTVETLAEMHFPSCLDCKKFGFLGQDTAAFRK